MNAIDTKLHASPSTCPFDFSCTEEGISGLEAITLEAFLNVAKEYLQRTQTRLMVTSAKRSLKHTASLMSAFSIGQLEGMYCRNGYPDYIRTMKDAMERLNRKLTPEETYEILRNRQEGYISSHLFGGAIDIAAEGLADKALLISLLHSAGFTTLDETDLGVQCIHASHSKVPKSIVRE